MTEEESRKKINVSERIARIEALKAVTSSRPYVVDLLQQLADYHEGTFEHSLGVGITLAAFTKEQAVVDNLTEEDIQTATLAGLLHDIGKMSLGDEEKALLSSPRVLTEVEREQMKQHARMGFFVVRRIAIEKNDALLLEAAKILVGHHEFQPDPYPRSAQETGAYVEKRKSNPKREKLQRYLAACDQAVSLSQGGEGGHSYLQAHPASEVLSKLQQDRYGHATTYFQDIAPRVVNTLVAVGIAK